MSSRQLRKLQQQRELEKARVQEEQAEEESEEEPVLPTKSKASLFANLAALEDEADEKGDSAGEQEREQESNHLRDDPAPTSPAKKPKKSKKKKKAKKTPAKEEAHPDGTDDIDAALRELNIKQSTSKAAEPTAPPVDAGYQKVCALLGINTQHLKVANEMRNLFGKGVTDTHEDAGGRGRRQRQRGQQREVDLETALKGHHLPGKGLPEVTLRRNFLVQGKDDWPKATTGGLTMEMVDDKATDGTVEFRFVHNQAYQSLQTAFHGYVEMGNPQNLIGLLQKNPYHVSLLIQVSKIAKDQTDHALSADLLERALFSFGRASTTLFNHKLAQGKARLDFARPENRELWLAGYQYIKALVMKGTYRTALEWAKLLLSLDPEADPYSMKLLIHNLAIRAHEFKYLKDLYDSTLPFIWPGDIKNGTNVLTSTNPSLAYASMQLKESTKCRELLSTAMQQTPWLFVRLFKELSLDAPSSIWGIMPRTDAERLFTEIYVLQTKDIWNTPAATALLMEIAHTIPKVDASLIAKLDNSEMTLDVVRYVYLDNNPAIMKYAPSQLLHRSNNSDADPLPPDTNIFSYEAQRVAIEGHENGRGGGLGDDFFDPLAALARLMPQFGRPQRGSDDGDIDADGNEYDDEDIRRELEEVVAEANRGGHDDGAETPARVSISRRLLNMLWGMRRGDELEEEEDDEEIDTETDDDMPDLLEAPRR